jgi:cell migration-inducing and hyaluronan-binding protein
MTMQIAVAGSVDRVRQSLSRSLALVIVSMITIVLCGALARPAAADECKDDTLTPRGLLSAPGVGVRQPANSQPNLLVDGTCIVTPGHYYFGEVNIVAPGKLVFLEAPKDSPADQLKTEFWAKSILIEAGGTVQAGDGPDPHNPSETLPAFGTNGGELTIALYGADQSNGNPTVPGQEGKGAICRSPATGGDSVTGETKGVALADCGIPKDRVWDKNGTDGSIALPGKAKPDFFYQYGTLYGDTAETDGKVGHFGYKVIGVSYDGTLLLRGKKGTTTADDSKLANSGLSWVRLDDDAAAGSGTLTVDRDVDGAWKVGDEIVLTSTDFLPNHSEPLVITGFGDSARKLKVKQYVENSNPCPEAQVQEPESKAAPAFAHVGHVYDVAKEITQGFASKLDGPKATDASVKADPDAPPPLSKSADIRAAVGLLSRSIRIVSGGDNAGETFDEVTYGCKRKGIDHATPTYSMGGQMVIRQGFRELHVQGVEFKQMGVGGRMGHYPVHFHMARRVPDETWIKDSSVNESMTRWIVLHGTLGVTLQRDVGWKSIGHGFFVEDGTETDNKFYADLGVFARAAVEGPDNPRKIPGILAENGVGVKFALQPWVGRSDVMNPTTFWIANGWNDFVGNMAVSTGTCGSCYWYQNTKKNNDMVEVGDTMQSAKWTGYSARPGVTTPIKTFYRNFCSSAMHALDTTTDITDCTTLVGPEGYKLTPIPSIAPQPKVVDDKQPETPAELAAKMYYPDVAGNRTPTVCPDEVGCSAIPNCDNSNPINCATTVIDYFTTSYNFAETNFSAIWLRTPGWYLFDHGFISDIQNGGLTFVSGGDYSRSSAPTGLWSLASHSVFVGATQLSNPYADIRGPQKADKSGTLCHREGSMCIDKADSAGYPTSNWAAGQRLFNIYDGPAFEANNAYLDIKVSECLNGQNCMYAGVPGVRQYSGGSKTGQGYLPNAAIGWKQPNGFYYPPSFHSTNLFFKDVDIRHYVITPVLKPGTYVTDMKTLTNSFSGIDPGATNLFSNFTDIDRQTVLNDDDSTLTGFADTLSVNDDPFYGAPVQAPECLSNAGILPANACAGSTTPSPPTARTNPNLHITTVLYPDCALAINATNKEKPDFSQCGSAPGGTKDLENENPNRVLRQEWRGGDWSRECTGPYCFGVPIYRQYLTTGYGNPDREYQKWVKNGCDKDPLNPKGSPTDINGGYRPECVGPFLRMSGVNAWQRDILTSNNGLYYIDTTRSAETQKASDALGAPGSDKNVYVECSVQKNTSLPCQPRSLNVFKKNETYNVFFLFETTDIKQTYQIYVGEDYQLADTEAVLFTGLEIQYVKKPLKQWPTGWERKLVNQDGQDADEAKKAGNTEPLDILQVTVDFSKMGKLDGTIDYDLNAKTAGRNETCRPSSFCKWGGETIAGATKTTCGCSLKDDDPRVLLDPNLKAVCSQTCQDWAVKDFDCPNAGCVGFSFKLGNKFMAADQNKRPKPTKFPGEGAWAKQFSNPGTDSGACKYEAKNTPGDGGIKDAKCGVPD